MTTLFASLVRYANDRDLVEKPYHAPTRFIWQLDLNADGSLASVDLTPLTTERLVRGKQKVDRGRVVNAPRMMRTVNISPMLGGDDIGYVLGWADTETDSEVAKMRQRHAAWVALTNDWAASGEAAGDPIPAALAAFAATGVEQVRRPDAWTSKEPVLIHVAGVPATAAGSASAFWSGHVERAKGSARRGLCVVCGLRGQLVETLAQPVKGGLIPGGQTSGVAPLSINEAVYGYALRKGLGHVPVCISCAQAIPASLNHLLSDPSRAHRSDMATTAWWVEGPEEFDAMNALQPPDDAAVRSLVDRVEAGASISHRLILEQFHSVVLEANAARMVVRDWTHLPVAELQVNICSWFADTRLDPLAVQGRWYHPLWQFANATGRFDGSTNRYLSVSDKAGKHPHGIVETLQGSALHGSPLPRDVASQLVQRVAADGRVDDLRVALLKLYLTRATPKGKLMPGLDPTNKEPAYLLGRLMSVLEDTQYRAATIEGGSPPNAGFVDKYLAGAIISPRLVLTTGGRQAPAWLSKLQRHGKAYFYRQEIDAIVASLNATDPGPVRATLEEQAIFLLGYHHQRAYSSAARAARAADRAAAAARSEGSVASENPTPLSQDN